MREIFKRAPGAKRLIVFAHGAQLLPGWAQSAMLPMVDVAQSVLRDADCFVPYLPIEFWRLRRPEHIVEDLIRAVKRVWQDQESMGMPYEEVILIGFSFGSVLTRSLYCRARGLDDRAELPGGSPSGREAPWVRKVSRVILLAGMNRGWTIDSPLSRVHAVLFRVATALGHLAALFWREPTLFAIRRGAPFLTLVRLQWLALVRDGSAPMTIQLLGTRDDLVSPTDNIDLATGQDFIYLEVPDSDHFGVTAVSVPTIEPSSSETSRLGAVAAARQRGEVVRRALVDSTEELRASALSPSDMDERAYIVRRAFDGGIVESTQLKQVVLFVMHGIRDRGYWTKKLATRVRERAREKSLTVQPVTSSYGYFAMLPFLLASTRREKVEWFLDEYVTARTLWPNAPMYFVGHSNGTYLLGTALERCRAVKFENVVLAGSVLQRRFEWGRFVSSGQVAGVLNYVATADWVVAVFPRVFEIVRFPWSPAGLGSAGHSGFVGEDPSTVVEREYVKGRHAAALDEQHWDDIASFLLEGPRAEIRSGTARRRSPIVIALGVLSLPIWILLLALVVAPTLLLLQALGLPILLSVSIWEPWQMALSGITGAWPPWLIAGGLAAHLGMIRLVLTKL